jgi:quercetin dioxygenase-like cupin family protein
MIREHNMKSLAWVVCTLAAMIGPASAANTSGVVSTPIVQTRTTNAGQPIAVPAHPTVIVSQTTIAPGARIRSHKHPWPHYVYVVEGTLTVVDETTGKAFQIKRGGFFAEMTDRWHHGENRGTTMVRLVAIDQVPPGVARNMVMKPGQ